MSDPLSKPWSRNLNAPQISPQLHFAEEANFAGVLITGILYGIVVILFFQCMGTLIGSANSTGHSIKWGLVAHTATMFSFVTVFTAFTMDSLSITYVENRTFLSDDTIPPGPFGYQFLDDPKVIDVTPYIMFYLNNWLADGLLLYRCYVIYTSNRWAIAFPCLVYLASLATGIIFLCENLEINGGFWASPAMDFGFPSFLTSLALNVLLTFMVVVRLVLHSKSFKKATGPSFTTNGVYKTVITMLVESFALYTVNFLLFVGTWSAKSDLVYTFFPILVETQAIAPLLIISRVASRSSLPNNVPNSGTAAPIRFRNHQRDSDDYGTLLDGSFMSSISAHRESVTDDLDVGVWGTVDDQRSSRQD